jgi:uncharacterized membrane protein YgdD (TMEM256/DUF423 family)
MFKAFIVAAGLMGFAGTLARSLSSHAIKPVLVANGKLEIFNLASDFLLFHSLALMGIALLCHFFPKANFKWSGVLFVLGSVAFQGSLLLKSFFELGPLGIFTPIGGALLMLAWLSFIVMGLKFKL